MFRAPWSRRVSRPLRPLQTRAAKRAAAAPAQAASRSGRLEATGFLLAAGVLMVSAVAAERRRSGAGSPGAAGGLAGLASDLIEAVSRHAPADPIADARRAARAEPGRGRDAQRPSDIPPRGWRDVLVRTWRDFNQDRIPRVAAGVTFYTLLSLFPAIGAFVSLYGLFADVGEAEKQLSLLRGFVPPDILKFLGDQMLSIAKGRAGGLSVAFAVSLLVSLWSANGAVKALFDGLNVAYEERERRGMLKLNLVSFAFTLGALAFVALALAAVVVTPLLLKFLGLDYTPGAWVAELRWPILLVVTIAALSVVYRFGPSRHQPRWRWINSGSAVAAVLWVGASLLFSWYVANFAHYNKTYGSLGAVVGFMTWIWYSTTIVLLGAELNSEIEHQTAVDTTVGQPKPMGARGAKMADTLGEARTRKLKPQVDAPGAVAA